MNAMPVWVGGNYLVLIPFKSGLYVNSLGYGAGWRSTVLIPFKSGLYVNKNR